jgi:hypothetical protein
MKNGIEYADPKGDFIMNSNVLNKQTARRIFFLACIAVLVTTLTAALPQPAYADSIPLPPMPDNLKVTDGSKVFLVGHAIGTQNYICLPSGTGFAFALFTPQATLSDNSQEQIITHFFSPNPENGNIRATWEHSRDTSTIWAATVPDGVSTNPDFVAKGAVAWLKLKVENHRDGPTGGDKLSGTTFVQRLSTSGGLAPATGCASLSDVGTKAFMPYTADYFFYK